mgnify:CR=1 FL=1
MSADTPPTTPPGADARATILAGEETGDTIVPVDPPIRDAATLVLVRRDRDEPRVLMGQRGKGAVFMPSKFVFPGGALDKADHAAPEGAPLREACLARLAKACERNIGPALARAAIRETFEETGLLIARPDPRAADLAETIPHTKHGEGWAGFLRTGHLPACDALTFVFRAITPPYRPRRFDARFFLADASAVAGDPDDFSRGDGELTHLTWLTLHEARALDLPLITEVVLAEVEEILARTPPGRTPDDRPAPFFHHERDRSFFDSL